MQSVSNQELIELFLIIVYAFMAGACYDTIMKSQHSPKQYIFRLIWVTWWPASLSVILLLYHADNMKNKSRLPKNTQIVFQQMEAEGHISYQNFIQVLHYHPEVMIVAERVLHLEQKKVLPYLMSHKVSAEIYLPLIKQELEVFYS